MREKIRMKIRIKEKSLAGYMKSRSDLKNKFDEKLIVLLFEYL